MKKRKSQVEDIYRYIDEHMPEYIERFQTCLRFPSVAAQNRGQEACASWFRDQLSQAGFSAGIEAFKRAILYVARIMELFPQM